MPATLFCPFIAPTLQTISSAHHFSPRFLVRPSPLTKPLARCVPLQVRNLNNAAGAAISEAGPSIAVQLVGLNSVPQAGDEFQVRVAVGRHANKMTEKQHENDSRHGGKMTAC